MIVVLLKEAIMRRLLHRFSSTLRLLVAVFFTLVISANACAQCSTTFYSLESRVGSAAHVYYGSIDAIKRTVVVARNGRLPGKASQIPGGIVHYELTIKVDEFLKGATRKPVRLFAKTSDYDKRFDQWADLKSPMLFFINNVEQAEGRKPLEDRWPAAWTYLRLEKPAALEKSYLTDRPPIFASDLTILRKPEEILKRARTFAKKNPNVLKEYSFQFPASTAQKCHPSCSIAILVLPMDTELEGIARRMLESPQDFIEKKWKQETIMRMMYQEAGIGAIRHFKSNENRRLLESFLNDQTVSGTTPVSGKNKGKKMRVYVIRRAAWAVLTSWGTDASKPVIDELISDRENE
jgi:hypothetical protein